MLHPRELTEQPLRTEDSILHLGGTVTEAMLLAFELLESDGVNFDCRLSSSGLSTSAWTRLPSGQVQRGRRSRDGVIDRVGTGVLWTVAIL